MGMHYSSKKKKILLLLATGIELGFNPSPFGHIRAWKRLGREWQKISKEDLKNTIREFYRKSLIEFQKDKDGTVKVVVTKQGKYKATTYQIEGLSIKNTIVWDRKWRILIFDIPEKKRLARNILRQKIKSLGFRELQKSVWVYPYDCEDVINFITDFYKIKNFTKYIVADKITDENILKSYYNLN